MPPGKTVVRIKKKDGGEVADTMNVWVVWCDITEQVGAPQFFDLENGGGQYIASVAGIARHPAIANDPTKRWRFTFAIAPREIITSDEKPDLDGERESPVPSEGDPDDLEGETELYHISYPNAFAGSAENKWDVTRSMQITLSNPDLIPEGTLNSDPSYGNLFKNQGPPKAIDEVVSFPTKPAQGNDDALTDDEDTNPYDASADPFLQHAIGEMTSIDRPWLTFDKNWSAEGDEFGETVLFREFARLEIWDGEREGTTWFRISDFHEWHFLAKAKFENPPNRWEDDGTSTGNGHD